VNSEEWGKKAQKLRVPGGMVLGAVFLVLMHPSVRSLWIGVALALVGAFVRVWAAGHIEKGKAVAQGGPYALTRNPLYLGSLLMATGVVLAGQGYWLLAPFAAFYLALYFPVMRAEEKEMLERYGDVYRDYAARVPLFVPRFRSTSRSSGSFIWSRVIKNGEHRTLSGLLLVVVFLIWRIR
jgi:protein-S-isoprenylcysteine O-methyltransferase Ste14